MDATAVAFVQFCPTPETRRHRSLNDPGQNYLRIRTYPGPLFGDCLFTFRSLIEGLPPPHWNF
jgi:hypothetical protein